MGDRARGTWLRLRAGVRAGPGHSRDRWSGGRAWQWRLGGGGGGGGGGGVDNGMKMNGFPPSPFL